MPGPAIRTRMLAVFVGAYVVLSISTGVVAWWLLERELDHQAEEGARSIGSVLEQGGFSLTPQVLDRMRELSGWRFEILPPDAIPAPERGTVIVRHGAVVVRIRPSQATIDRSRQTVILATLGLTACGTVAFGLLAWLAAAHLARPVERLAGAARRIGAGDLDTVVPSGGAGEVGVLAQELDGMRVRLSELLLRERRSERLAAMGTFTATVAHEVRNPLTAVRLTVQRLRRQLGDDPGVVLILEELERLDLIVDELLSYAKGMQVERVPTDLAELSRDVLRLLRRQADHAGVAVSVDAPATLATGTAPAFVSADPRRLRQLLLNLVLNAIQAQHGGGMVVIHIHADGLTVADRGPGVAAAIVPTLFQAFSTRSATTSAPGSDGMGQPSSSTGLGLHLAKAVAEAHGATLSYAAGHPGARFTLAGLPPA